MATQEERLTTLEQVTRGYRPALQNLTYEFTMTKGIITEQGEAIEEIRQDVKVLSKDLRALTTDFQESIKQLVDYQVHTEKEIADQFSEVKTRLDTTEKEIADQFSEVKARLNAVESTINTHTMMLQQILERLPQNPS